MDDHDWQEFFSLVRKIKAMNQFRSDDAVAEAFASAAKEFGKRSETLWLAGTLNSVSCLLTRTKT